MSHLTAIICLIIGLYVGITSVTFVEIDARNNYNMSYSFARALLWPLILVKKFISGIKLLVYAAKRIWEEK